MIQPFRWDVRKREQLGGLLEGQPAEAYPEFWDDLRVCCARVLSACQDGRLVCVGRSPESLFDYLSGALNQSSWATRLSLLNISLYHRHSGKIRDTRFNLFCKHLSALELDPQQIASKPHKTVLVDVVQTGTTYNNLSDLWLAWAKQQGVDLATFTRKMHFIGLVWQGKTSPKTWRWQQHAPWLKTYGIRAAQNVAIPGQMWSYIGDHQSKVSRWNPPDAWGEAFMQEPPREDWHLEALRLAYNIYQKAQQPTERSLFLAELTKQPGMKEAWFRSLVQELK